jgi:hypothetical protein
VAYEDRYGSTEIKPEKFYNLSIGWEYENDPEDLSQRFPVLLFTPDMENTINHHHISFTLGEARILHEWLGKYLSEQEKR